MKTKKRIYFMYAAFLFSLLNGACKKDEHVTLAMPPPDPRILIPLWRSPLDETNGGSYSINPIVNREGNVLVSNTALQSDVFKLFDGKTGKLKWTWSDFLRPESFLSAERHTVVNDALILSSRNATYAMDMVTGQTLWKNYIDTMYGSASVFSDNDGYVYKGFQGEAGRYTHYLFRTKYNALNWELVNTYTDSTMKFDRMNTASIAFIQNAKGDRLAVYTLQCDGAEEPCSVICCYNVSKGKEEWTRSFAQIYSGFRTCRMQITQDHVFTLATKNSDYYLAAIRLSDGQPAWEKQLRNSSTGMVLYQDHIIISGTVDVSLKCFDQQSGNEVWQQSYGDVNFGFGDMTISGQYLMATLCHEFLAMNAGTGQIVYRKKMNDPVSCIRAGAAVNKERTLFYAVDPVYINCFKMPELLR